VTIPIEKEKKCEKRTRTEKFGFLRRAKLKIGLTSGRKMLNANC
jgi:hypothetical protein